jgi:hypothetical protein
MSSIGAVLDLSAGGMRVLSTRSREGEAEIEILAGEHAMSIRGRVAWSRRVGFRKHLVGIAFIDVDAEIARRLARISSCYGAKASITGD